ncbi:putative ammonium transporter Rh type B [Paratrimastix pyriformis]|uniref:Ammonium transporter Rh type B n=1 Tax=Paratrimastix pyriformis TaxID=342808 RepID=A0ABQ8UXI0_9EUKA|nr:putative ammonium transporter Rh type B [Paratrimastix pyriformis]
MVDIQNATLAGGVAIGSAAEMRLFPVGAIAVGILAGLLSCCGYRWLQPFLERTLGLHDTCGVHNLHGMPGLLGGLVSVVAAVAAPYTRYTAEELETIFPHGLSLQWAFQFLGMGLTMAIALSGGILVGALVRIFKWPHATITESGEPPVPGEVEVALDRTYFEVAPLTMTDRAHPIQASHEGYAPIGSETAPLLTAAGAPPASINAEV